MKTTMFVLHLLLTAGYPAALVAELSGVMPTNTISLPVFMAVYVTTGVLAVAFLDYIRKPSFVGGNAPVAQPRRRVTPVHVHPVHTTGFSVGELLAAARANAHPVVTHAGTSA